MTVEQLIADIKLSNNGYIFTATDKQVAVARENKDIFRLFGISLNGNPKIGLR